MLQLKSRSQKHDELRDFFIRRTIEWTLFFSIPNNYCYQFNFEWLHLPIFSRVLLLFCIYCYAWILPWWIYFYMLENDVVLTVIYGYHMERTYEFIGPLICTQYVSITVSEVRKIHRYGPYGIHTWPWVQRHFWKILKWKSVKGEGDISRQILLRNSKVVCWWSLYFLLYLNTEPM